MFWLYQLVASLSPQHTCERTIESRLLYDVSDLPGTLSEAQLVWMGHPRLFVPHAQVPGRGDKETVHLRLSRLAPCGFSLGMRPSGLMSFNNLRSENLMDTYVDGVKKTKCFFIIKFQVQWL